MNSMILAVSWFLAKTLNGIIVLLGITEIVLMVIAHRRMISLRKRIDVLNFETRGRWTLREKSAGKIRTERLVTEDWDWNEFNQFCSDYQKESVLFSGVSLIIQIFPLLGILGTVTGLFIAMSSNADWSNAQELFEGVRFALSSTVLGILFAVIFKVADIVFCAKYLGYIDDGISRFRENYNVAKELSPGGDEVEKQEPARSEQ